MYNYILNLLRMLLFLIKNNNDTTEPSLKNDNCGILVTRWSVSSAVYYNIALSLLIRKSGFSPFIIYDNINNGILKRNIFIDLEISILLKILNKVRIIYISDLEDLEIHDSDVSEIMVLSRLNAFYKEKTTVPTAKSPQVFNEFFDKLSAVSPKINRLFSCKYFDRLIVPGGIYGNSGLYLYYGKKYGVRVATHDSGPNILMTGTDDVAAYLNDIPKIISSLGNFDKYKNEIDSAGEELEKRRQGNDRWQYQPVPFNADHATEVFDVVMPLNVEIDSASLMKSSNFESMYFWLTETVDFILNNTRATIAIKEHPSVYNNTDFLKNKLIGHLAGNPRVRYYSRNDKVNTYELLYKAKMVLPYTSTVGIEAAIMGKCVVVESGVYYSQLPFVINSTSKNDYFDKIINYLEASNELSKGDVNLALLCYYFTQKCSFFDTYFTSDPSDFLIWSKKTTDELLSDRKVELIMSSLLDGIPLAKLNHENYISKLNVS